MIIKKYKVVRLLKRVLIAIAICLVIYFIIRLLDKLVFKSVSNNLTEKEARVIDYNTPAYGNLNIKEEQATKFDKLIGDYVGFCNNKEYDKAYELIDNDTKSKFFPTIEEFKKDVDAKFNKIKRYEYKNIVNDDSMYAYRFILFNDPMTYGSNWNESDERAEYILVIKDNEMGTKLNINSYIKNDNTSNLTNVNGIKVETTSKEIYYDYMMLKVKITNNTKDIFVFSSRNIYYITKGKSNAARYQVKNMPLNESYSIVQPGREREFIFRFDKLYAASFEDYAFTLGEGYLVSMDKNIDIITNTLSFSEIKDLATNKFDINVGL